MIDPKKTNIQLPLSAFSIITLFIALMIIGIAVMPILSVQLFPSPSLRTVFIDFDWPSTPAEIVEQHVTTQIEGVISTINGVKSTTSLSSNGHGHVQAILDDNINTSAVRYEIATLLRQIYPNLPAGTSYPMIYTNENSKKDEIFILSYTISGIGSTASIQQFAEKYIEPQLALITGVSKVNIYGAAKNAWNVFYDPEKMNLYNISDYEISAGINQYFTKYELGKVSVHDEKAADIYSYLSLKIATGKEINWNKIPIKKFGKRTLFLTDIAKIYHGEQIPRSFYRVNGSNTINLEITAARSENYIVLADKIKKKIELLSQQLPAKYSIELAYDASEYLKHELSKIIWRSLITIALLLVVIILVSRQLSYVLLILISLSCNLLIGFLVYYLLKLEIHLYSLAGISISMGIIIDNSIVVIDHIRHKNNLRVFLAVTGATLAIIGAISIIFFLGDQQQTKLLDFAWVVIINLAVSMLVAFFLIPSLIEKLPKLQKANIFSTARQRNIVLWNTFYIRFICFGRRFKVCLIFLIILIFGVPLFLLPLKIQKNTLWARVYNQSFGSNLYVEFIGPFVSTVLGGSLRLFILESDRFSSTVTNLEKTELKIDINMPIGSTVLQMNNVVRSFDNYLKQFPEVEQFKSRVSTGVYATITIKFRKDFANGSFPFLLKNRLEIKAANTGLADFSIVGIGQGFNNRLNIQSTNCALTLSGYNYQDLKRIAEQVKSLLIENSRVESIIISSERLGLGTKNNYEYVFEVNDPEKLLTNNLSLRLINNSLTAFSDEEKIVNTIFDKGDYVPIIISSGNKKASVWQVMNGAVKSDSGNYVRLKEFASIKKENTNGQILRVNQQYQLVVNYNFIGDRELAKLISNRTVEYISKDLALGYDIKGNEPNFWEKSKETLVWAIVLTIAIVFVICAVLLNSLRQSLAVIAMIPISFVGVFLAGYLLKYRFDEGSYTAFVILCGVVVTAALYILNDYNNAANDYPTKSKLLLYLKAYNSKIIPILLSRFSILIGVVPIIIYSQNEPFWYPMAISTASGLLFSMIGILVFLPLFLKGIDK